MSKYWDKLFRIPDLGRNSQGLKNVKQEEI
jgi:hypothetical protein